MKRGRKGRRDSVAGGNRGYKYSVFVRNISYKATKEQLEDLMHSVGPVKSFKLFMDTARPDRHRGRATCEYYDYDIMRSAIRNLDNYNIGGRTMYVGIDTTAILPDIQIEDEEKEEEEKGERAPKRAHRGTTLSDAEAKQGYQMLMAAKMFYEDDPEKFKRLCRENQETTLHLVQMGILMGMNPGLVETAQQMLAKEMQEQKK